jgi:hypothetical protein
LIIDKVNHEQAEKQKEVRRKEKGERAKEEEAKRAAFEATMAADRDLHEKGKAAGGVRRRQRRSWSSLGSKSPSPSKPRLKPKLAKPRSKPKPCEHGARAPEEPRCKDCGTGNCEHGRRKSRCKDCGTGHCEHPGAQRAAARTAARATARTGARRATSAGRTAARASASTGA